MKKIPGAEEMMAALFMSQAKARIYLYLSLHGDCFAEEIANGTRMHPSTVREALSEMVKDGQLFKEKAGKEEGTEKTAKAAKAGRIPSKYSPAPMKEILHKYMANLQSRLSDFAKGEANGRSV
jgi:predicted ArsR family transcriptional regulator